MTEPSDTYDRFLALVKARHPCRGFKPDPIPDDAIEKILEAGRRAMSGANSQPWERDPAGCERDGSTLMATSRPSRGSCAL
jgi:hypothetical protein